MLLRSLFGAAILSALLSSGASAGEVRFREHAVDPLCVYSAAAAIDVNHDGKLDIVTGGQWFEAPDWKRHSVRDVEFIRGRFDDYGCLPLDVNGDGWTDFATANYRSQKVAWIEHPGAKLGLWTEHVIEKPGPSETGRLADVDGDGQLDILPNGRDFAAWWEFARDKSADGKVSPRWIRHDLPPEVVGHGVGFGDINGDGRGDVIGPGGWLEAPTDRKVGRWIWHPEFQLGRDASVPIVVFDADGDGDNDLAWGRGHGTGLWWLEQTGRDSNGVRQWNPHAIDTSWSQPHTVEIADIDNDGKLELISGKRYLGHDGNDLGEWNPLVIYWYKFDTNQRTWQRHAISEAGRAGFDVDPKLVDLDADGDLDLLAPGRSGLYWFENLLKGSSATSAEAEHSPAPPTYADHARVLVYKDAQGHEQPVKTAADWARRRADVLSAMQTVMGPMPDPSRRVPLAIEVLEETPTDAYLRKKITFASEQGDRVPAYLLIPNKLSKPAPAMLCLHPTNKLGKKEVAGVEGRPTRAYADELAKRGYVCIVPDYPSFGDYPYDFKQHGYISGTMKAIWNNVRALDVLETLTEVDPRRIGAVGHSLGGHNAIFTAVFDMRIRAVITSCGFTAFHDYYGGKLAGWTSDRYMPRIRDEYQNNPDRVPFDFTELLAALAPRSFFTNSPLRDANFDIGGVRKVMTSAGEVYKLLDAEPRLVGVYPDCEHDFPDAQRREAYEWLDEQWKKK